MAGAAEPAAVTLSHAQLGDLELILSGAFAPLRGFMTAAEAAAVTARAALPDGTPWPAPVTLEVPPGAVDPGTRQLVLADPEGTPLAVLDITESTPGPGGLIQLAGPVTARREPEHGPFRRLMLSPGKVRAELGDGRVLAFASRGPLGGRLIGQLADLAARLDARLLLLPLTGGPAEVVGQPAALVRAVLAAAASLPAGTLVIPVPLPPVREQAAGADGALRELAAAAIVAASYGATHLAADAARVPAGPLPAGPLAAGPLAAAPIAVLPAEDWAYDPGAGRWRPRALIEPGTAAADLSAAELGELLDAGAEIPSWLAPESVISELRRARKPRSRRGLVLFLTGLSGSGKSTLARDLADLLAEHGDRAVSLLDGDLVRQLLSAGLTFSRQDRDLNIARIAFVAAEVARHGGIAICAPIAPFAQARERARAMISQAGDFLLIHVATPLEVCEQRDRKGLYAKARAGLIGQFTGISDPYEEPADADLVLDTSVLSREQAARAVLGMLTSGGWLAAGDAAPGG